MDQDQLDYADICGRLLNILHSVLEPALNCNVNEYTMESYARGLATKYYNHALTILDLSSYDKAANIPYLPAATSAFSSIQVLTRAAFETFLVLYHIFVAPVNQKEMEFRFMAYALAGCMERATSIYGDDCYDSEYYSEDYILYTDRKAALKFRQNLKQNSVFKTKDSKDQRNILNGKWHVSQWRHIARDAKLSDFISNRMYPYLCGYAHSGSLSVRQTQIIQNLGQQHSMIEAMLLLLCIYSANVIANYCDILPSVKSILLDQPQAESFVDFWIHQGRDEETAPELLRRSTWFDSFDNDIVDPSNFPKSDTE
jgi:hypothetical protein